MSLLKNPRTGNWEADFRSEAVGRLHVSLRTKKKAEAIDRHGALQQLVREHPMELIDDLRGGRITIEAITRVHQERTPFMSLARSTRWPSIEEGRSEHMTYLQNQTENAAGTLYARDRALKWAGHHFGDDRRLDTIIPDEIGAWRAQLLAEGVEGAPVKPWTAAQYLIHFGALYNWVIRREERAALRERRAPRLLHNPVEPELIPRRPDGRMRFLSKDEAQRLLVAAPDQYRVVIALGLFAGLRAGEVQHLRPPPHDIDLENATITVQEKEGWRPKSRKRREVPIAPELMRVLVTHLERYSSDEWLLPAGGRGVKRGDKRIHAGAPVSKEGMGYHVTRAIRAAGLITGHDHAMGVTMHTLRHTFASWLVMAGVDLFTVSKLLGHADTKQVEATYAHLSPDHKQIAVRHLGGGLSMDFMEDDTGDLEGSE